MLTWIPVCLWLHVSSGQAHLQGIEKTEGGQISHLGSHVHPRAFSRIWEDEMPLLQVVAIVLLWHEKKYKSEWVKWDRTLWENWSHVQVHCLILITAIPDVQPSGASQNSSKLASSAFKTFSLRSSQTVLMISSRCLHCVSEIAAFPVVFARF